MRLTSLKELWLAKTKVSDPGRSLKPLLSRSPVPARIAVWASSAAMPMFSPSQTGAEWRNG